MNDHKPLPPCPCCGEFEIVPTSWDDYAYDYECRYCGAGFDSIDDLKSCPDVDPGPTPDLTESLYG